MNVVYLGALIVSIAGMVVLDLRFKLFFAVAPIRAALVLLAGLVFFLAWDVAGITLGIFFRGDPGLLTGILLAPELPVEELFFLVLLGYTAMNCYAGLPRAAAELAGRIDRRTRKRAGAGRLPGRAPGAPE